MSKFRRFIGEMALGASLSYGAMAEEIDINKQKPIETAEVVEAKFEKGIEIKKADPSEVLKAKPTIVLIWNGKHYTLTPGVKKQVEEIYANVLEISWVENARIPEKRNEFLLMPVPDFSERYMHDLAKGCEIKSLAKLRPEVSESILGCVNPEEKNPTFYRNRVFVNLANIKNSLAKKNLSSSIDEAKMVGGVLAHEIAHLMGQKGHVPNSIMSEVYSPSNTTIGKTTLSKIKQYLELETEKTK